MRYRLIGKLVDAVREVHADGSSNSAFDGLRVLQHPGRLHEWLVGNWDSIVPVTVEVWPSLSCNARCPSCPYRRSGARDMADSTDRPFVVDRQLAVELPRSLAASGVASVMITGGGEPLVAPTLMTLVEGIRRSGLAWGIFTNGELLRRDVVASLAMHSPRWIRVSLDAGTAEVHRSIYGTGINFDTVVANIVDSARLLVASGHRRTLGVSFAIPWWFSDRHLEEAASLTAHLVKASNHGLASVAVRPRAAHFSADPHGQHIANVPLPHAVEFASLGPRALSAFGAALEPFKDVRLDVKLSLFTAASGTRGADGSGSGWMTVVDQDGEGFLVSELAGAAHGWGNVTSGFAQAWNSQLRIERMRRIFNGEIKMPPMHRLSPLDAMLGMFRSNVDSAWLTHEESQEFLQQAADVPFFRSSSYDFV